MTETPPAMSSTDDAEQPLLIAMLPARNAAADLPGYLDNVSSFCDAVVALDDGSTDDTAAILAAHPLVVGLLRNPRREDYRGWDDAANRNQLLRAAWELRPAWLISLDADERLDDRDASSLRHFLATDTLPGFAYGLRHVPMRGDAAHFVPRYEWAYRLFSAAPGQRFSNQKLHFVPVPTSIPRTRWVKTTLRIQHFGELTGDRRLGRFSKYLEADPRRKYQDDYARYLAPPSTEDVRRWQPRPAHLPFLIANVAQLEQSAADTKDDPLVPTFSVVIVDQGRRSALGRTIASAVSQQAPGGLEVLVVTPSRDRLEPMMRTRFPSVAVVDLPHPVTPGEARNRGLQVARGRWVTFPAAGTELLPGNLAARLEAHRRGYAVVSGTAVNGATTAAGWVAYFLDHSVALPGLPSAETDEVLTGCSFARLPLVEVGGFPEDVADGEEAATNRMLAGRGYVPYRDDEVRMRLDPSPLTLARLLRKQFRVGRASGAKLVARHRHNGRLLRRGGFVSLTHGSIRERLDHIEANVALAAVGVQAAYRRHRHLVILGAMAAWAGTWWEVLRPGRGKLAILWGRPVLTVLVANQRQYALAQIDSISGEITLRPVPADLPVPVGAQLLPLREVVQPNPALQKAAPLAITQSALGTVLGVAEVECVIDSRLPLPDRPTRVPAATVLDRSRWAGFGSIRGLVDTALARHGGRVRSTLGLRSTAHVLTQIRVTR